MSAYAALVSLQKLLLNIVYFQPWITHNTNQLQILLNHADSFLNFLIDSSAHSAVQISSLETKIRDAAYKAEDLIEFGILDSDTRMSYSHIRITLFYCLYIIITLTSGFLLLSYVKLETVPASVEFVLEIVFCLMNALFLYLCIREICVFSPLNDSQQLLSVLYDFEIITREMIQIEEAHGEAEMMSAHAALVSLLWNLDSIPDSSDREHLKYLKEMVIFLLDFLQNASTSYMSNQNLDSTIIHAVSKAKRALIIEFRLPRDSGLQFESRRFSALMSGWSFFLPHLVAVVMFRTAKYFLRTSTSEMTPSGIPWKLSMTFEFESPKEMKPFVVMKKLSIAFASYLSSVVVALVVLAAQGKSKTLENVELPRVIDDFSVIVRDVVEIKYAYGNPSGLIVAADAAGPSSSRQNSRDARRDVVVGLDRDVVKMKENLFRQSSDCELSFIVGMGGIGKTTLARQVFNDPSTASHFSVRAWVTISQEYAFRHVLLSLLDSAEILTEENRQEDEDKLTLYLHKHLKYRRYLIVMDDVWDVEIWSLLRNFFPEDENGSRILITSRLPNIASSLDSCSPLHHMQCLNENDSWHLLREKAFGARDCPLELESVGREIAQNCGGLPLAIVVIGGLLHKDIQTEVWRDVAEKLQKSELQDIREQCLEILDLSYNHLPHHLRPCFLYMAVFLRDFEISISRLINLWVAEGFLKQCQSKTLEEVAEDYVKDLIDRNLISVYKESCNGKIRSCRMHDLLRDVCIQNARKEKFLHVMDSDGYVSRERVDDCPRRLSIHPDAIQVDAKHEYVRSVLCITSKRIGNEHAFYLGFVYLRVLDVLEVHFVEFPHQITKLVYLRYLAFHYDGSLPASIARLQDLETIVHHSSFRKYPLLPRVIWTMTSLRHLYVKPGCYLSESLSYRLFPHSSFLEHLQTLVGIRNLKWSKGIIERIPNLKKLGISYDIPSSVDWSMIQLDSLVDLNQLETLKIIIKYDDLESSPSHDPPKLAFPQKLKKLSLCGCRIPWERMADIGTLPDLEALKVRREAFSGSSWETREEEFPQLVFLLVEEMSFTRWETDASHFPRLQRLVIRSCDMLEEIPSSIGDIPTLEMIQLVNCHPSAVASAKEIQEEQESEGNEELVFKIEQRRTEVDEMSLEVEGVGPGVFEVVRDSIQSGGYEIMLVVLAVGVIIIGIYFLSREVEIRRGY